MALENIINKCNDLSDKDDRNYDRPSEHCDANDLGQPQGSRKDVSFDNLADHPKQGGLGSEANCDPMLRGWSDELKSDPSRETITRYSQVLRAADEAMKQLFDDIIVIDDNGGEHKVPIVLASPEKAVAFILQDNVRKDGSFVVDRIMLPILSIYRSDIQSDPSRYMYHRAVNYFRSLRNDGKPGWTINENGKDRATVFGRTWGIPVKLTYQLSAWTLYTEDMNQIIEQIHVKSVPYAYIRIQDVNVETMVKHESTSNNNQIEPGDKNIRVIKYGFNYSVETYIPQPIIRKKAVLGIKADVVDFNEDEITDVLGKIEVSTEE